MEKQKKFIEKAIKRHGNKYDYSKVEYVDSNTKVCIICPEHGEFWQTPQGHVRGNSCPKCANGKRNVEMRITTKDFIKRAKRIHGDFFDYSKTDYINARTKVCIICPEHGEFWQMPFPHLKGYGCPKCAGKDMDNSFFIEKARKIHSNKYDYSKVEYTSGKQKVCIICPEHGEFWQAPVKHLYGQGCPQCGINKRSEKQKVSYREYLKRVKDVHGDKYEYPEIEKMQSMHDKINIICKKHGDFIQLAYDHLAGHGCPKCAMLESNAEREIYDFICKIVGSENVVKKDRVILEGREIDILIPSLNIGFEYNGLRWHSEEFGKDSTYHLSKTVKCNGKGIKLIQIFEDEYLNHKDVVLEKIKHILGKSNNKHKIFGRKCLVSETNSTVAEEFLNKYHIQGYSKSTVCLCAYYENNIVAVMTFKRENKNSNKWELTRFASDYNYVCCGVGGKLFKYFVEKYNPDEVKSFADRRWTINEGDNLYTKLGFILDGVLKPDYRYINMHKSVERIHKFNFRKQNLNRKYGFPLTMTESEMAKELDYVKIWDCGLYRYIWKNNG